MALEFLSPLHKASRQIGEYLAAGRAGGPALSNSESHLLTYLRSYAPAPVGELVRVFGMKQSTLTSLLDRLEEAGYLRRELNPDDRRSFLIHVTAEGRKVADQATRALLAFEEKVRARVNARDLQGFRAVMAAIGTVTEVRLRER